MRHEEETHFHTIYEAATVRLSAVRRIAGHAFDTIVALQRWPTAWRFAFAIAIVVVAEAIRFTLLGALGERLVYVTLYPAVTVAALVSGLYGGILATIVAALLAHL